MRSVPAQFKQDLPIGLDTERQQGHTIILYQRCTQRRHLSVATFEFVMMGLLVISMPIMMWRKSKHAKNPLAIAI